MTAIYIRDLSLVFPHKTCFEQFNCQIPYGSRIAIIGRNGSGKSTLLSALNGLHSPKLQGDIILPDKLSIGFVPQIIEDLETLSGGQRFNALLSQALAKQPDLLLLDEPTNHLDEHNRRSLMRMLNHYHGTFIVVSHDETLLRRCVDTFWHIEDAKITVFSGSYANYQHTIEQKRNAIESALEQLSKQKKQTHQALMQEQTRAANSRRKGEKSIAQRKWSAVVSNTKMSRAQETSGKKKTAINQDKAELVQQLSQLHLPEVIKPKFSLNATQLGIRSLVLVREGTVSYGQQQVLSNIDCSLITAERIAILGENATGKSTFIRALLKMLGYTQSQEVLTALKISGSWILPQTMPVAYLDQHYHNLNARLSVLQTIQELVPEWNAQELRRHLNDFLFRKNEEVELSVASLSGGEKARLSLAQMAALTPELLILDELTNNLDLVTKTHVTQVLNEYPGALIVISHDRDFIKSIGINHGYQIENQTIKEVFI